MEIINNRNPEFEVEEMNNITEIKHRDFDIFGIIVIYEKQDLNYECFADVLRINELTNTVDLFVENTLLGKLASDLDTKVSIYDDYVEIGVEND